MPPLELLADFVDENILAAELKRHPRTIFRWSSKPDGLPFLKLGHQRLYHLPTVRGWLLSRVRQPNVRRAARASQIGREGSCRIAASLKDGGTQ